MHHLQPIQQATVLLGLVRTSPINPNWVVRAEVTIQALYVSYEACSDHSLRLRYARYIDALQGLLARAEMTV